MLHEKEDVVICAGIRMHFSGCSATSTSGNAARRSRISNGIYKNNYDWTNVQHTDSLYTYLYTANDERTLPKVTAWVQY